jgi:O-antigen ligase
MSHLIRMLAATRPPAGLAATVFLGGVLVALNVVVDRSVYDVSQLPRLVALLGGLLVAVPGVLLWPGIARRLDWRPLGDPLVVAAAGFLLATGISLAGATNVSAGLTDLFRTMASFLVLCLGLVLLPLEPRWRQRLLETAVVATLVAVGVGCWELWPLLQEGAPSRRDLELAFLDGMMSNVNLFAGYLLVLLPWCVCAAVQLTGGWRPVALATATAALGLLVVLQSRAAWLGLFAAAAIGGATILRHRRQLAASPAVQRGVATGLLGCLAALALGGGLAFTDTPAGQLINRLVVRRPHQQDGPSDGGRTMVWGIAAEMLADHPATGVGGGNFPVRMHEYLASPGAAPRDFSDLSSDNWIHPHNDFLEVAAEHGLPGLVAFAAVFLFAGLALRRVLTGDPPVADARLATASLAALAGYLVFSCLDFPLDRISHQAVLAVHLAVIVLLDRANRPGSAGGPVRLPGWLIAPPLVAAVILGIAYAAAAVGQERAVLDARRAQQAGDWKGMREAARRATTPWKSLDPLAVPVAFLEGFAELQLGELPAATACFERAFAANPNRLATLQNLGAAYAQAGRLDDAIDIFAVAADRYPHRVELRHNLAMALIEAERFAEAIAVLEDVPEPLRTEDMQAALAFARERAG